MLEDAPDDFIHDLFYQNFWKDHALGRPIIGNEESVNSLTRDSLLIHKDANYQAGNIIIAAAGKVRHEDLLSLVGTLFDDVLPGTCNAEAPAPVLGSTVFIQEKELEQLHLCLGTKALPQNHLRRFESYILNAVLGGSMSSRLFQEVREKLGLAYSIYSYMASHTDSGSMAVYAGISPERLDEVVSIILREMGRLKRELLSSDELSAAKEQLKGNILLSLESSDNRMSKLAKNEIYFGTYQHLIEIMKGFDRVTSGNVLELAEELFAGDCLNLVMLGKPTSSIPLPASLAI